MSEIETKFKYYYKHRESEEIRSQLFSLDSIECLGVNPRSYFLKDGYEFMAREQLAGYVDYENEIYIGDIIKFKNGNIGTVVMYRGCFCIESDDKRYHWNLVDCLEEVTIETIGNIYQNKDLLNDSN